MWGFPIYMWGALLPMFASHFHALERSEIIKEGKGMYLHMFGCVICATLAFVR